MKGCERGACADETRSGTCGPHRSEPVREPHAPTLFNLSTWMPQPTLFVPLVSSSCFAVFLSSRLIFFAARLGAYLMDHEDSASRLRRI